MDDKTFHPSALHPDLTAIGLLLGGLPCPVVRHLEACRSCQQGLAAAAALEAAAESSAAGGDDRAEGSAAALGRIPRRRLSRAEVEQAGLEVEQLARLLARELLASEARGDVEAAARLRYRLAVALLIGGRFFQAAQILAVESLDLSGSREASRLFALVVSLVESDAGQETERFLGAALERARKRVREFDAALAALALTALYLEQGRAVELRQLVPTFLELARSEQLAPEARRAILRLAQTLGKGRTPQVVVVAQALRFADSACSEGKD